MIAALTRWAAAFALTQLVEMPIYVRALGRRRQRFAIAFTASAITHPIIWFVVPALWMGRSYVAMAVASEAFAVLAESVWLARFDVRRALAWSFAANAASVCVGLAVRAVFGWP